jgi:hypothetical protein
MLRQQFWMLIVLGNQFLGINFQLIEGLEVTKKTAKEIGEQVVQALPQ